MSFFQTFQQLHEDADTFFSRNLFVCIQNLFQCFAIYKLHNQAVVIFFGKKIVECSNVGMRKTGGYMGFLFKPFEQFGLMKLLRLPYFDCHLMVEVMIPATSDIYNYSITYDYVNDIYS